MSNSRLSPRYFLLLRSSLLVLLMLTSSCATGRINQFKDFSQAGIAYADAIGLMLEEAGLASIDGDSDTLINARQSLKMKQRQEKITKHNNLLKKRLSLLSDLRRHANLLKAYFIQLGALTNKETRSDLGSSVNGVFQAMAGLNDRIKKQTKLLGPVAEIVVANFQNKALERELKKRAKTIERELEVQQIAMDFISEELKADLQIQLYSLEKEKVINPFKNIGALPPKWKKDRKDVLTSTLMLSSVEATADAAKNLKMSFVALVEGRKTNIAAFVQDLNELVAFLEAISEDKKE